MVSRDHYGPAYPRAHTQVEMKFPFAIAADLVFHISIALSNMTKTTCLSRGVISTPSNLAFLISVGTFLFLPSAH